MTVSAPDLFAVVLGPRAGALETASPDREAFCPALRAAQRSDVIEIWTPEIGARTIRRSPRHEPAAAIDRRATRVERWLASGGTLFVFFDPPR